MSLAVSSTAHLGHRNQTPSPLTPPRTGASGPAPDRDSGYPSTWDPVRQRAGQVKTVARHWRPGGRCRPEPCSLRSTRFEQRLHNRKRHFQEVEGPLPRSQPDPMPCFLWGAPPAPGAAPPTTSGHGLTPRGGHEPLISRAPEAGRCAGRQGRRGGRRDRRTVPATPSRPGPALRGGLALGVQTGLPLDYFISWSLFAVGR